MQLRHKGVRRRRAHAAADETGTALRPDGRPASVTERAPPKAKPETPGCAARQILPRCATALLALRSFPPWPSTNAPLRVLRCEADPASEATGRPTGRTPSTVRQRPPGRADQSTPARGHLTSSLPGLVDSPQTKRLERCVEVASPKRVLAAQANPGSVQARSNHSYARLNHVSMAAARLESGARRSVHSGRESRKVWP